MRYFAHNRNIHIFPCQGAYRIRLEGAMLHRPLTFWVHDKVEITALLMTLLFFASFYLGFVL
jgi:hypothetical protein